MKNLKIYITGVLMAMADSVPGVSGGTICYIMGIYDKLISSVSNLTNKEKRPESLRFLLKVAAGWIIGFIASILVISNLIETHIYEVSSMFLGFIILSIPITFNQEKKLLLDNKKDAIFALAGFIIVVLISYIGINYISLDVADLTRSLPMYIYIFAVAALAISCMLLPGISGSTMLLIFGAYYLIIDSIKDLLTLNFGSLDIIIVFIIGMITGGFLAVKGLNKLFSHYRSKVLYLVQGLMIGSIYAIIVGPQTQGFEQLGLSTFKILAFAIGGIIMLVINRLGKNENKI